MKGEILKNFSFPPSKLEIAKILKKKQVPPLFGGAKKWGQKTQI